MPKFCIYLSQLDEIKYALTNGGIAETKKALEVIKEIQDYYAIAGISKGDIAGLLLGDVDRENEITDNEIEQIASDMERSYLENGYWIDLNALGDRIRERR